MSPAEDLELFSPFSELGFGNGEPECLCLGGSGVLGWLAVPETHLEEDTFHLQMLPSPSGRDALWLCLVWLQLYPERPQCEPAQGPRPWWLTGGWCPAQESCTTERALSPALAAEAPA